MMFTWRNPAQSSTFRQQIKPATATAERTRRRDAGHDCAFPRYVSFLSLSAKEFCVYHHNSMCRLAARIVSLITFTL